VVSDTGVAGLTLGGGYGWLRNKFGLSCDNLLAAEVVLANGQIVRASAAENPDLFWALRGGGGNFGVVTAFQFQLHPVGPEVQFAFVFHPGEQAAEGLRFYREYCEVAPEEASTLAFLGVFPPGAEVFPAELHGRTFIAFGGLYAGDPQTGERLLDPLRTFSTPLADFSGRMPYPEAQQVFDEDYPRYTMRYYWKSINLLRMDEAVIARLVEHGQRQPSPHSTTDIWHIGGAVKRTPAGGSAFFGRHAAFLINPEANWEHAADDAANIAWVRETIAALEPFSDGSRYLNFAGLYEEGEALMAAAFGANYRRLAQIKHQYDPTNLFRLNQNIPPQP
jgi:FAD/FMN-containing dehydrogenase